MLIWTEELIIHMSIYNLNLPHVTSSWSKAYFRPRSQHDYQSPTPDTGLEIEILQFCKPRTVLGSVQEEPVRNLSINELILKTRDLTPSRWLKLTHVDDKEFLPDQLTLPGPLSFDKL